VQPNISKNNLRQQMQQQKNPILHILKDSFKTNTILSVINEQKQLTAEAILSTNQQQKTLCTINYAKLYKKRRETFVAIKR
jgi:hypothetical protein